CPCVMEIVEKGGKSVVEVTAQRVMVVLCFQIVHVGVQVPAIVRNQDATSPGFGLEELLRQQAAVSERRFAVAAPFLLWKRERFRNARRGHHSVRGTVKRVEFTE